MPLLWYYGTVSVPELTTHHHFSVRQGGRAETASSDGGGHEGKHGKDLPGLHNITKLGNVLEVPGSYDDSMGVVVDNIMKVGGKPKDVRDVLQGGGAGSTYF